MPELTIAIRFFNLSLTELSSSHCVFGGLGVFQSENMVRSICNRYNRKCDLFLVDSLRLRPVGIRTSR